MANTTVDSNPFPTARTHISGIDVTSDTLTGRGGLALFSRYLRHIELFPYLERLFGPLRKSGKGVVVGALFHQILCFLVDATSRHLVYFDALKDDEGYARGIETAPDQMASSHTVKRFFTAFNWGRIWLFRRLLRQLFVWRLRLAQPEVIVLGLDTMVMDNDEAQARQGCQPTYKKVKGFQPLQLTWGPFIVDALFRGGKKNGNAGQAAGNMVADVVRSIRRHYRTDVPILLRTDSGFFDQKLFRKYEELEIGFLCAGKLYDDIIERARDRKPTAWSHYANAKQVWQWFEFWDRRESWRKSDGWRAFYIRPLYEDEQRLLAFARPDTVIYTNLGGGKPIDTLLETAGHSHWTEPESLIELYHGRGADELVHRALKDFRAEQLPFKRFRSNAAFYYTVLVAFFLFEAFKRDVTETVVPITAQATRVRRQVIDFAAKIVRTAGQVILKVPEALWGRLRLVELWNRTADPPVFAWA
jgi:hypothetical protein